jgi:hypothetical protein
MPEKKRRSLTERVREAAERTLAAQHYVSLIDVLLRIGWLYPGAPREWQQGRIECLEAAMQIAPERLLEAMKLLSDWAAAQGLVPSEGGYVARTPTREQLRFSKTGNPDIERRYRIHWVSPELSEEKREKLTQKASAPPELLVIIPLKADWKCHRCGETGDWLMMEKPGPACLRCVGLDDLEFLPSGNALLTRRAKAKSARHAVVVKFSRTRRRYERQGLLVEANALREAQEQIEAERK